MGKRQKCKRAAVVLVERRRSIPSSRHLHRPYPQGR